MIELHDDRLVFRFPEVHPGAWLELTFQRTLRVPDDGKDYPLPPGLGRFPLRHVDDFEATLPRAWMEHGGVMLPMYQAEALWLNFDCPKVERRGAYPFAVRVATGKIDAVSGQAWQPGLAVDPQNYVIAPKQPWLDGYCVEKGAIRQFVAMPLGAGYTAEEQITGSDEVGGIQIQVYPMRRQAFERHFPLRPEVLADVCYSVYKRASLDSAMGVAPGGRIQQQIFDDPYGLDDWDRQHTSRCFVHLANSRAWRRITGSPPPTKPITALAYTKAGMPWFDFYDEGSPCLDGAERLKGLKSVSAVAAELGDTSRSFDQTIPGPRVVPLRRTNRQEVREWAGA